MKIKLFKDFQKIKEFVFRQIFIKRSNPKTIFTKIHNISYWGNFESVSGEGSSVDNTRTIRKELSILIDKLKISSMLDCPCGDFNWMKEIDLKNCYYIGGDIVPELIAQNKKKYDNKQIKFRNIDIINDSLPQVDMILCRDGLVHLSFKDIETTIKNIVQSKSKYLLVTTFTNTTNNIDINTGDWRAINLQLPPFNFPKPIKIINEKCKEADGTCLDKCLALYKIKDLL